MKPPAHRPAPRLAFPAALCLSGLLAMCTRPAADPPVRAPEKPSVRLVFASTVAGAMEPCGCRKDMLGGLDHAAALLESHAGQAAAQLLLASGPVLFLDPKLDPARREQDLWKAESIASSLADIGLGAWAPGVNDFAAGEQALRTFVESAGAQLVAANFESSGLPVAASKVFEVGGYRVGVAGIGAAPSGLFSLSDAHASLSSAVAQLKQQGAQILVALIAARRGEALRLVEKVPDLDVVALGKAENHGETNEPAAPPTLIDGTLIVQGPNHLQGLAYVDLFVKDGGMRFEDGMGLERQEREQSLVSRIEALDRRLAAWKQAANPSAEQVAQRQADTDALRRKLSALRAEQPPAPKGSWFTYHVEEVREGAGASAKVTQRMTQYYRRVNEHNRIAFKDRKPKPAKPGEAHFVGMQECSDCHGAAEEFWKQTGHAKAYITLADDHKQFNLDCVSCHVTGYEKPGGSTVTFVEGLKDVQCEACHGAGSRHADDSDAAGLITLVPDQSVCRGCHHPPHVVDDWDVEAAWKKIVGPGHGEPLAEAGGESTPPAGKKSAIEAGSDKKAL